jgi:pimeloyl-ACP methyl ester carboxylesterase/class 3 adenylate cyclase
MAIDIRYARVGEQYVAYALTGSGSTNLIVAPPITSNIEIQWDDPHYRHFIERLGSFASVAIFDKRGTGLSGPIVGTGVPTLEQRMDDVLAVMDALRWEEAALLGYAEGGSLCILFAASYPDRVTSLTLINSTPRLIKTDDYPWGWEPTTTPMHEAAANWGRPDFQFFERFAPGMRSHPDWVEYVQMQAREQRFGASPGIFTLLQTVAMDIDVRSVLPAVRCPTLIMHRKGNKIVDVGNSRYLAEKMPEAKYIELDGADHYPWFHDSDTILDHIHEFITGHQPSPELDRVLATILFTDIVGSTARAAEIGDHRWKPLLEQHHSIVRKELTHFRGREIDTAGDGFFATFDGPARGVRCALSIRDAVRQVGLEIRAGLHTGECEIMGPNVGGLAVHIGARVAARAGASEVLVSSTVKDLVAGSGITFEDRGLHQLKGVPDEWHIFAAK